MSSDKQIWKEGTTLNNSVSTNDNLEYLNHAATFSGSLLS